MLKEASALAFSFVGSCNVLLAVATCRELPAVSRELHKHIVKSRFDYVFMYMSVCFCIRMCVYVYENVC